MTHVVHSPYLCLKSDMPRHLVDYFEWYRSIGQEVLHIIIGLKNSVA